MKRVLLLILLICTATSHGKSFTFSEAVQKVGEHNSVLHREGMSKSLHEEGKINGSWGDPKFKIAAKNFPKGSMKDDESPMTGVEFSIGQKISLTTKYGNIEDAYHSKAKAMEFSARDRKEFLIKSLWKIVIDQRKILDEVKILKANLQWISRTVLVSKKLYINGRISQQALFDIQIRKTEIESEISNKKFDLLKIKDSLSFLVNYSEAVISERSIPWSILNKKTKRKDNNKKLELKHKLLASTYGLTAAKLNYVPDLTFSVGYTKRNYDDGMGDFIGAQVSFPLPLSGTKYAKHEKAINKKYSAQKKYRNYQNKRSRDITLLEREISKIHAELKILTETTINFAKSSRKITSKSYSLGKTSYVELLQSEFKLQKIQLKKILLESKRDNNKVALRYLLGESLHE